MMRTMRPRRCEGAHGKAGCRLQKPQMLLALRTLLLVSVLLVTAASAVALTKTPNMTVSSSSDMTLTASMSPSPIASTSFTTTISSVRSTTPSISDSMSITETWTLTDSAPTDMRSASVTASHTPTSVTSATTTVSSQVTDSSTMNVTRTVSFSASAPKSQTPTPSSTDDSTHTFVQGTFTLTETLTLSLTQWTLTNTRVIRRTHSTSKSPTSQRTRSNSSDVTISHIVTAAASRSFSQSVSFGTVSPQRTKSPLTASPSVSFGFFSTTISQTRSRPRTLTGSPLHLSLTITLSVSAMPTNTLVTKSLSATVSLSPNSTVSMRTVSTSITASIINLVKNNPGRKKRNTMTLTLTPSAARPTMTFSVSQQWLSQSRTISTQHTLTARSTSHSVVTESAERTQTFTLTAVPTRTESISRSVGSASRSQETFTMMATASVTRSDGSFSVPLTGTKSRTATLSSPKTYSVDTSTMTLTVSLPRKSRTHLSTKSRSVSPSGRTMTDVASETETITKTVTNSTSVTPTAGTQQRSLSVSSTPMASRFSGSLSASQGPSESRSESASPSEVMTHASETLSRSGSKASSTYLWTVSHHRPRSSRTSTFTADATVTVTLTVTGGSATRSSLYKAQLSNAFLTAIGSVLFPSLQSSVSPCISLALYIEFPLFLVFLGQVLLLLVARSLNWKVTTDTYRDVPMWRSIASLLTYAGVFIPCHTRCAYFHTLRCMFQMLIVLLVLTALVDQIAPVTNSSATFVAAITIVVSQVTKPAMHLAFSFYRFPNEGELDAKYQLSQMKRIIRLRRKEAMEAKKAERDRRRAEGLDDVSTTTEEEPEFAYDLEDVVAFDYLDTNISLNKLRFGADLDVDFPEENVVFHSPQDAVKTALHQADQSSVGPGYVDITFPGDEDGGLKIVDLFSDERVATAPAGSRRPTGVAGVSGDGSFRVKNVNAIYDPVKPSSRGSKRSQRSVGAGSSRRQPQGSSSSSKKKAAGDDTVSVISLMSLGSLASFDDKSAKPIVENSFMKTPTLTHTAIAIADEKDSAKAHKSMMNSSHGSLHSIPSFGSSAHSATTFSATSGKKATRAKPRKKRIGPNKHDVVELPTFDDDMDAPAGWVNSSDEDEDAPASKVPNKTATTPSLRALQLVDGRVHRLDLSSDSDDPHEVENVYVSTKAQRAEKQRRLSNTSRFRLEQLPIKTFHYPLTIGLVLSIGVLLFAVDRYRFTCRDGVDGSFQGLWGLTLLVDIVFGDAAFCAIVYFYRYLVLNGEEGRRMESCLHPYPGECRDRLHEHLSQRFFENISAAQNHQTASDDDNDDDRSTSRSMSRSSARSGALVVV